MSAVGIYVGKLLLDDLRAARGGQAKPGALPGAVPTTAKATAIAVAGALAILAAETWGEGRLGLTAQQSRITWLFGAYTLVAAIVEEVIFRGYLAIERRGKPALWAGIAGASVVFAAVHPFLWKWDEAGFGLTLNAKGWFSTGAVFAMSLWLYAARFAAWNRTHSLLPCIAAHGAKNLGVFAIKLAQGFVGGAW
jgi:membrane protease YdiL (CAAX protease family)